MELLVTKYEMPLSSGPVVRRDRLLSRFDEATRSRLTLIAAPAGSGKTTLAVDWCRQATAADRPFAWLALEPRDNEPERFWSYMVGALGQLGIDDEDAGFHALPDRFDVRSDPTAEPFLNAMLNTLAASSDSGVIVFDDFHHIDDPVVLGGLDYFVRHLPLSTHLVLLTRREPALALETHRIRSNIDEIDGDDLRFDDGELNELFRIVARAELQPNETARIQRSTEGWAAALKLAALALRRSGDLDGLMRGLEAGSPRYLSDFLVNEVLDRQGPELRSFILDSAVLGEFNEQMCDEITGRFDSAELAARVREEHLFLQRLDRSGTTFRYHPLFATVVRDHLALRDQERVAQIHASASSWFEAEGNLDQAVRHAAEAGDIDRIVRLVIANVADTVGINGACDTARAWAHHLRDARSDRGPRLLAAAAFAFALSGRPIETAALLDELGPNETADDDTLALISSARILVAFEEGDYEKILELTGSEHPPPRSGIGLHVQRLFHEQRARALMLLDRDEEARVPLHQALTLREPLDPTYVIIPALLAHLDVRAGRLHSALRWVERSLQRAVESGAGDAPVTTEAISARALVALERGDVDSARQDVLTARQRADLLPFSGGRVLALHCEARALAAQGLDHEAILTLDTLADAHPFGQLPDPVRRLVARERLRLAIGGRDEDAIDAWSVELRSAKALRPAEDIHSTIVADGPARAAALADDIIKGLDHRSTRRTRLEVNLAAAAAYERADRHDEAVAAVGRAAEEAEPEGMLEPFRAVDPVVSRLIEDVNVQTTRASPRFVHQVVHYVGTAGDHRHSRPDGTTNIQDPLSERELSVLRLLRTALSFPEIANELHVSRNTVKTHVQHIYRKLGTSNRAETIDRARDTGLLT